MLGFKCQENALQSPIRSVLWLDMEFEKFVISALPKQKKKYLCSVLINVNPREKEKEKKCILNVPRMESAEKSAVPTWSLLMFP